MTGTVRRRPRRTAEAIADRMMDAFGQDKPAPPPLPALPLLPTNPVGCVNWKTVKGVRKQDRAEYERKYAALMDELKDPNRP